MATFNETEATSMLREIFAPKIVDTVFQSNPLFAELYRRRSHFAGGRTLSHPLMHETDVEGVGGEFDVTDQSFGTETAETFNKSQFTWRAYQYPVKVHMIELAEFSDSDAAAINLIGSRSQQAALSLSYRLGNHLFKEAGTGPKQILSLNDAFGRSNTYGQIDRSAAGNSFWQAKQDNMDSTGGSTATALTLRGIHDTIENATEGQIRPTFGITDVEVYNKIWGLALSNQRYGDTGQTQYLGFPAFKVDGIPIIKSKLADDDGDDSAGNPKRKIRFLNVDFWHFASHRDYDFVVWPFRLREGDSPVWISRMFWFGNTYTDNPRFNSELINILST